MFVSVDKKNISMGNEYDYELYNEIKKIPDSSYDENNNVWVFDKTYILHFLEQIKENNNDIVKRLNGVVDNIDDQQTYNAEDKREVIKTVKLNVKENSKSITINFDYDKNILNQIKNLENRQYNSKNKSWRVQKSDIDWLYEKLKKLNYVDISELEKFTSNHYNSDGKISPEDFPSSTIDPYNFQIDTVNKLVGGKKVIDALEAGLGKTAITVMACEYINKPTLIICPATIKENWKKEIYKINKHAEVNVLNSKDEWKMSQYVIINYDIIDRFMENILNEDFNIVVFDEAHKLRGINGRGNPSSKRAKLSLQIASNIEYVFPITATPFINYTKDIFNLLRLIDHPSSDNWFRFANTYCQPDRSSGFGVTYLGSSNKEKLNERLYPNYMVRLKTEDYVDLPDRIRNFIPVKINMSKYNKAIKDYLNNRIKFNKNGQHLVRLNIARMELALAKAKESVNLIKDLLEQDESVVVFTNYTDVADYIESKFNNNVVKITGDVEAKDRQNAVDMFQNGEKKVFVGNIDAAGEGITLTKAAHMVVIDFHWSPVTMVNQMEKRIHRISQTRPVNIHYLYVEEAEIDQMLLEMLEDKLNDSSLIMDGKTEEFFTGKLIKQF
ncbi:DEAD/DEAH box helicase [Paraliobacillus ryukyuensis]|uniref:DEAD/DEAH box helicase n=1 Tax=Paraliobacillus ryukyuensis TaxID=200904 RepID=UPI0009A8E191|nr:DEAD/DEAH box helicase [Paraliobacillus ryukyuensis]